MGLAEGRRRLLITIDDELLVRIEAYCKEHGMTKSQFFTSVSLAALSGSSQLLPQSFVDSFVRNAMSAELRSQMREVLEAQRSLGVV